MSPTLLLSSLSALAITIAIATPGIAQTTAAQGAIDPAATSTTSTPDRVETVNPQDEAGQDIVVTGSRIDRAGYDAPTPTIRVTAAELSIGARTNVAAALNDLPQFRATTSPATTGTNTGAGTAPVDLRGLGVSRTLVLLDGRRFSSDNDLNTVPTILIKSVDVVTGGASAAWGSGAVAGVVNIGIDDRFNGMRLGAQGGISSYKDAGERRFEGAYGTDFANGRGHFLIGVLLATLASFASSAGSVVVGKVKEEASNLPLTMAWSMLWGTLMVSAWTLLSGQSFVLPTAPSYLAGLVYLAIFGSVIAFYAYFTLIDRIGPQKAVYVTVVTPVISVLLSIQLEHYRPGALEWAGMTLCLASVAWALRAPKAPAINQNNLLEVP